jgi:hypothetical protein
MIDYRPALAIVFDDTVIPTNPTKDITKDYGDLTDKATNKMSKNQGKA